jgi:hypothetical protein
MSLFGTTPERIDLFNRSAETFFGLVFDVLWDDILLHISRMTDREKVARRETLTIRSLPRLVVAASNSSASPAIQALVDDCLNRRPSRVTRAIADLPIGILISPSGGLRSH